MPQIIEVPGFGGVEFPDDMTDDQIVAAIKSNMGGAQSPAASVGTVPSQGSVRGEYLPDGGYHVEMSHTGATAPQPAQQGQERSLPESLFRQGRLTLRAGLTGLSAFPEMLVNPVARAAGLPEMHLSDALDAFGLPKPVGATERISQDVASSMAGAGGAVGLGKLLTRAVSPTAQAIGDMLSSYRGTQTASAASGSGAASSARETGFTPGQQMMIGGAASLLPTMAPYAAATTARGLVRGSEAGRQVMLERARQFREATGQEPTVGQATGRMIVQGAENQLGKTLGSTGIMTRKVESQVDALRGSVEDVARGLSPSTGAVDAGESIAKGLEGFKQGFRKMQGHLYGALDDYLPGTTPISVNRTQEALKSLTADIEDAESVSLLFRNAKIGGLSGALSEDLERSARAQIPAGGSLFNPPKPDLSQATLPYEAIKKLRTLVGEQLADQGFTSDVPRSKWKALYAALSDDLGDAAKAAGPQAQEAWEWANSFTRQQMQRLDDLSVIMNKDGPEKIFQAAMSGTSEGNTVLKRVFDALPKQNRRDMAAAVLRRLGRATPGRQNDLGDVFSPETFLTNWARMSPEARKTLFGRLGVDGIEDAMGKLAGAANIMRDSSRALANPSGTGADVRLAAQVGGGLMALGMGNPYMAATALVGIPSMAQLLARALVSPRSVENLTRTTQMNPSTAAIMANELANLSGRRQTARPRIPARE
ncbi:hypothetical protein ACTPOE_05615 [Castellaniella sp. WN]